MKFFLFRTIHLDFEDKGTFLIHLYVFLEFLRHFEDFKSVFFSNKYRMHVS